MKKHLQNILSFAVFSIVMVLCGIGLRHTYDNLVSPSAPIIVTAEKVSPNESNNGWQLKEPSQSAEYIEGPLVADTGELCVFRLSDMETKADWVIVPPATCYIDSSGSSLAFASNISAKYTIIAAIVEEGVPKILTHICEYGVNPQPQPGPGPSPNPDPTPKPNPPPITTLKDWVTQNIPVSGVKQAAALASCYESAVSGIENGSIRSQEAAFSVIRTATQTKIDVSIWAEFLDALSEKITEKLAGSSDVKLLGTIFNEIAEGLKSVSDTGTSAESEVSAPVILPFTSATCPDSTCKPTVQPLRRAR